jgi:threonine dehydrogenase-like Zn-dependent dehydrogenase
MPEVILDSYKAEKLRVLARGMGWEVLDSPKLQAIKPNGNLVYLGEWGGSGWDPFDPKDWHAAGELLGTMRTRLLDYTEKWERFVGGIEARLVQSTLDGVLEGLTPAIIAEAAYEALSQEG